MRKKIALLAAPAVLLLAACGTSTTAVSAPPVQPSQPGLSPDQVVQLVVALMPTALAEKNVTPQQVCGLFNLDPTDTVQSFVTGFNGSGQYTLTLVQGNQVFEEFCAPYLAPGNAAPAAAQVLSPADAAAACLQFNQNVQLPTALVPAAELAQMCPAVSA